MEKGQRDWSKSNAPPTQKIPLQWPPDPQNQHSVPLNADSISNIMHCFSFFFFWPSVKAVVDWKVLQKKQTAASSHTTLHSTSLWRNNTGANNMFVKTHAHTDTHTNLAPNDKEVPWHVTCHVPGLLLATEISKDKSHSDLFFFPPSSFKFSFRWNLLLVSAVFLAQLSVGGKMRGF